MACRSTQTDRVTLEAPDLVIPAKAGIQLRHLPNGGPGLRAYHAGYYAAFVLDPDGNNIEVVHHGEVERSADSVTVDRREDS